MPSNPNPQYYRREQMSNNVWSFAFDSIQDYDNFIEEKTISATDSAGTTLRDYASGRNVRNMIRTEGVTWFGTTVENEIKSNLDSFLYGNEMQQVLSNIRNRLNKVDVSDLSQKNQIKFTEQELGIFSFDLASLGLIKVYEYYSSLLDAIVNSNLVQSYKNQDDVSIFYYVGQPYVPEHTIEYSFKYSGYYSEILNRVIQKEELILKENNNKIFYVFPEQQEIPRHNVERKQKLDENGKKKFATTFKKCFVYIPKVEKLLPRLEIIVPFSFNSSNNADTLKFNAVPTIALAETLSRLGVNYKIVAAYPIEMGLLKMFTYLNVKQDGEALDINKMALFMGDPRYYRYQRFRGINAVLSDAGLDSRGGNGNWDTITDTAIIKDNYMKFLAKSPNPEDIRSSQNKDTKIFQRPVTTETAALAEYERIIDIIKRL
ncbi:MAG: hypothetical protein ACOVNU_09305 [Candidatus Kapaibacteriota bacterium]